MIKKVIRNTAVILLMLQSYVVVFSFPANEKYEPKGRHLQLNNGDNWFFWLYTIHSSCPSNPIFTEIENRMDEFKPDLVLVEGGANKNKYRDREHAISCGESAYAVFYARQKKIEVKDIEPDFSEQVNFLQKKYTPESILALYIVRQIGSVQLTGNKLALKLDDIMHSMANTLVKNGLKINSDNVNNEYLLKLVNSNISTKISCDNWETSKLYREYGGNKGKNKVITSIYNDLITFRNSHLVDKIDGARIQYKRVFVVMGYGHLQETKKKLEYLYLKSPIKN